MTKSDLIAAVATKIGSSKKDSEKVVAAVLESITEALANGEAKVGACSPGGEECADALAAILGVEAGPVERKVALVHCMGSCDNADTKMEYQGMNSCAAAAAIHEALSEN